MTKNTTHTDFYVYRWIRLDTGMPFYVGKGRAYRYLDTKRRSEWFKRIISKVECKVEISLSGLTDEVAIREEKWLIRLYRLCNIELCNLTDGGEGMWGHKPTDATLKKMSAAQSGKNHPMYGRQHTEEAKEKISKAVRGACNPFYGKKHTDETRAVMSKKAKGSKKKKQSKEHIEKRMASMRNTRLTRKTYN